MDPILLQKISPASGWKGATLQVKGFNRGRMRVNRLRRAFEELRAAAQHAGLEIHIDLLEAAHAGPVKVNFLNDPATSFVGLELPPSVVRVAMEEKRLANSVLQNPFWFGILQSLAHKEVLEFGVCGVNTHREIRNARSQCGAVFGFPMFQGPYWLASRVKGKADWVLYKPSSNARSQTDLMWLDDSESIRSRWFISDPDLRTLLHSQDQEEDFFQYGSAFLEPNESLPTKLITSAGKVNLLRRPARSYFQLINYLHAIEQRLVGRELARPSEKIFHEFIHPCLILYADLEQLLAFSTQLTKGVLAAGEHPDQKETHVLHIGGSHHIDMLKAWLRSVAPNVQVDSYMDVRNPTVMSTGTHADFFAEKAVEILNALSVSQGADAVKETNFEPSTLGPIYAEFIERFPYNPQRETDLMSLRFDHTDGVLPCYIRFSDSSDIFEKTFFEFLHKLTQVTIEQLPDHLLHEAALRHQANANVGSSNPWQAVVECENLAELTRVLDKLKFLKAEPEICAIMKDPRVWRCDLSSLLATHPFSTPKYRSDFLQRRLDLWI